MTAFAGEPVVTVMPTAIEEADRSARGVAPFPNEGFA